MTKLIKKITDRAKKKGGNLLLFLGIISILGFFYSMLKFWFGIDIGQWGEAIAFFIIFIALMFESNAKKLFKGKIPSNRVVPKIFTFIVGVLYGISAIILIPAFGINLDPYALWFGIGYLSIILVIAYEVFLVK